MKTKEKDEAIKNAKEVMAGLNTIFICKQTSYKININE